ncbi:hypothetical protein cypCar_00048266 [Cyprinus carpio]|nr:hypothetical protein cypCar_00048266 [Cyprinus carpio]
MSVCDTVFDQQDAEVVCRELDCGAPVQVLGAAAFDKGDTQMWTQEIQCRGNESQIRMCPASQKHSCSHDDHQALQCADVMHVRLVNGNSPCAGRVEVLHRAGVVSQALGRTGTTYASGKLDEYALELRSFRDLFATYVRSMQDLEPGGT